MTTRPRPGRWRAPGVRPLSGTDLLRAGVEGLLVVVSYLAFTHIQDRLGGNAALASANGRRVQHLEAFLHVDVEAPLNHWAAVHTVVAVVDSGIYGGVLALVPVTLAVVALHRTDVYPAHRSRLVVLSFASLVIFALFPVSPPRLDQPGIVDVVAAHSPMGKAMAPGSVRHADLYAAMPSLHVAWSLWCALALRAVFERTRPLLANLVLALPAVVAVDVMATGNHYVLDVAAGLLLTTVATLVVRRGRPIWRPGRRTAAG